VSIVALQDATAPFADTDNRLVNIAVGFLPRDVRFAADGSRAVVISRDTLTPIDLLTPDEGVAMPLTLVPFDGSAAEILVDADADRAILRYAGSSRIDVVNLADSTITCFETPEAISDMALARNNQLALVFGDDVSQTLALTPLSAAASPCTAVSPGLDIGSAQRLALDPRSDHAIAYRVDVGTERLWHVDLALSAVSSVRLEKAVAAVAFTGDGRHALLAHMKLAGQPAWNSAIEDPEVSVDKSYGVSWIDMNTDAHRLAVSDVPFGPFAFVPGDGGIGVTYQAVLDGSRPQVVRVAHQPGFDDRWLDLTALPQQMGFLPETRRTYVTQDHPWGRVTFIDPTGDELRHVTGFAL
jgi:hypothetical protein